MKKISVICTLFAAFGLLSCQPEEKPSAGSTLTLSEITMEEEIKVPGTLAFELNVKDGNVDLSTLDVSASLTDGTVLAAKSVRTPGREFTVKENLDIPFAAGMANGAELIVSFEAINVNGDSKKQVKKVSILRPVLPETLYMTMGETVLELTQSLENPNRYVSEDGTYENVTSAIISTKADLSEAEFVWGAAEEDNKAAICNFSEAEAITISYPSVIAERYSFDAVDFVVAAEGKELNVSVNGTKLEPAAGLLYANVAFTQNSEVEITGIENLDAAWNRDFFSENDGKFTFLRESGNYDVYYSPRYNYLWIVKNGAVAPECLWIVGHGFTSSTTWNEDYADGGWEVEPVTRLGYAVKVEAGVYQASMLLNNKHIWASFEFEIYSDLEENKNYNTFTSLSGFTKGIKWSSPADGVSGSGLTSDMGFQPGYYTITFDTNKGEIVLDRISEWEDTGGSGIFLNATELLAADDYNYADIYFEHGATVQVSGVELKQLNRDFFNIDGEKITFAGVSGTYRVQHFPKYEYIWLTNEEMTFPDCLYILGCGKWSAPVFDKAASWDIDGWTRSAPMLTVAPKIDEDTWKATMSMCTDNQNWKVMLELYSDLNWGQEGVGVVSIDGDAASFFHEDGFCINGGWDGDEGSVEEGNYEFIFKKSGDGLAVTVKRID